MFSHQDYENSLNPRHAQFNRLLSNNIGMRQNPNEYFSHNRLSKEDLMRTFERLNTDPDDADDEDDDQTPTGDRPAPKFP